MRRGTNPTLTLKLTSKTGQSVDASVLTDGFITFQQDGRTVIEKRLNECERTGNKVIVELTQKDTLRLDDSLSVRVQGKFKIASGKIIPTKIRQLSVSEILNEEVL